MHFEKIYLQLRVIAMTLSGFLISCTSVVLLFPLIVALVIYSRVIFFMIKMKHGDKFTRPGGLDVLQGVETFRSRPYINATARYEGKIDIDKLRKKFIHLIYDEIAPNGQVAKFRRLRQILVPCYGYHIFKDAEDFDIKNHIKRVTMTDLFPEKIYQKSQKGFFTDGIESVGLHTVNGHKHEKAIGWEEIMHRFLDKFGISQMSNELPQWQLLLLDEDTDHSTILFKINHGFTDGIYFLRFFLEFVADKPVKCFLPYNYHQPNWTKRFLDGFWAFCLLPFGISRLSFPFEDNPFHGPEISGEKMYLVSKSFSLNLLKEIKSQTKVSVNAVLFSCLSNAIASHFIKKQCQVPYVIVLVPISLQDLNRPARLKNGFGLKGVLLQTFIDKNSKNPNVRDPQCPVARLKDVQSWVNKTANDPAFLAIHWLCVFLSSLLPTKFVSGMLKSKGLTTTLSNIAGPQDEDHYITGCKKCDFAFWIPDRSPLGMGVSVAGYKGSVRIGLMIDKTLMDNEQDGYEFLDAFIDEVHVLHNTVKSVKDKNGIVDSESSKLIINKDIP